MDSIPATCPKRLTKEICFANFLLIVEYYSNITKRFGLENVTTEEVMGKLDMFQERFGKVDEFGW